MEHNNYEQRGETWVPLPKELADKRLLLTCSIKIINAFCGAFLGIYILIIKIRKA